MIKILKRTIMLFVLADNFLTNLARKIFKTRWVLTGKCRQCGSCCREIYLKMTPGQLRSELFTKLSVRWLSWLFGFKLIRIDRENHYLIFSCEHLTADNKCGNYFWRPNVCRNYPLVDYFKEPGFLPGCGFKAVIRGTHQR
ncbi:MAG: YkgJ family cysteine cluster protein [Candidatus Margulisbacteria bacterium]|nr:YkgJ family cysteine cluster protein [Candidatus Margulisiibacteriota bacterium]